MASGLHNYIIGCLSGPRNDINGCQVDSIIIKGCQVDPVMILMDVKRTRIIMINGCQVDSIIIKGSQSGPRNDD